MRRSPPRHPFRMDAASTKGSFVLCLAAANSHLVQRSRNGCDGKLQLPMLVNGASGSRRDFVPLAVINNMFAAALPPCPDRICHWRPF